VGGFPAFSHKLALLSAGQPKKELNRLFTNCRQHIHPIAVTCDWGKCETFNRETLTGIPATQEPNADHQEKKKPNQLSIMLNHILPICYTANGIYKRII